MIVLEVIFFIILWFIGAFLIVKAAESFGLVERYHPESRRKIDDDKTWDDVWEK